MTDSVGWDEDPNLRDYEIVFLDLLSLDLFVGDDGTHNTEGVAMRPLPSESNVVDHLGQGHDIVAILPTRTRVKRFGDDYIDLFNWVPGQVPIQKEEGNSVLEGSIDEDWAWYFDSQPFDWDIYVEENSEQQESLRYNIVSLIQNVYRRALACRIDYRYMQSQQQSRDLAGSIYLIPLLDSSSYADFVQNALHYNFGEQFEPPNEDETPEWTDTYSVPGEEDAVEEVDQIQSEITELERKLVDAEEKLEGLRRYKGLLYGNESFLEELIPEVFEKVGFDVEGEIPHARDGLIELDDHVVILEIHGTTSGIPRSKCQQLDNWVGNYQYDNPSTSTEGLFVVNPLREEDPSERSGYLSDDVIDYLEMRGHKMILTEDMFRMLFGFMTDQLTHTEIREKFTSESTVVDFENISA